MAAPRGLWLPAPGPRPARGGWGRAPAAGSLRVDGTALARVPAGEWRARLAGAFQDFFRFEFRAGHTVGLGDVPRLDDEPAVVAAVDRAGAGDVVGHLASGLDTQL